MRLWNAGTGLLVRTLRGHVGDVNYVAFSPDGSNLATGGDDGTVRLWSLSATPESITLGKHDDWVNCVLFTPDGRRVISGGRDGIVKFWDAARARMLSSIVAGPGVEGLALSPDGRTLATAGADGKIGVWSSESSARIRDLGAHTAPVQSVAFSHDGLRLAAGSVDGSVEIWDVAGGHVLATGRVPIDVAEHQVQCVAFSPDDRTLATCGNEGAVRLWDSTRLDPLQTYRAEGERLWCVAFSRDGRAIVSCGGDGLIRQWDIAAPQDRLVIRLPGFCLLSIAIPAGSDRVLVAGRPYDNVDRCGSISSWDMKRGVLLDTRQVEASRKIEGIALSRDGKSFSTLEDNGHLTLWDTATGRVMRNAPAIHIPEGHHVASLSMIDGLVAVNDAHNVGIAGLVFWDPSTDRLYYRIEDFFPLARVPESEDFLVVNRS